jgi:hypothetical protein
MMAGCRTMPGQAFSRRPDGGARPHKARRAFDVSRSIRIVVATLVHIIGKLHPRLSHLKQPCFVRWIGSFLRNAQALTRVPPIPLACAGHPGLPTLKPTTSQPGERSATQWRHDEHGTSAMTGRFSGAMENAATYRKYAEDCKLLAQKTPQHRDALLKIAAAWADLAEQSKKRDGKGKSDGHSGE